MFLKAVISSNYTLSVSSMFMQMLMFLNCVYKVLKHNMKGVELPTQARRIT